MRKTGPDDLNFLKSATDKHTNKQTDKRKVVQNSIFGTKNVVFFVYQLPPPSNDGEYKLSVESARTSPKRLNQLSSNASVSINNVFFVHFV